MGLDAALPSQRASYTQQTGGLTRGMTLRAIPAALPIIDAATTSTPEQISLREPAPACLVPTASYRVQYRYRAKLHGRAFRPMEIDRMETHDLAAELAQALSMLLSVATDERTRLPERDLYTDMALNCARHALGKARDAGLLTES